MILDRISETEIFIIGRISNSLTDSGPELHSFGKEEGADKGFQLRITFVDSADKKLYSQKRALKFKRVGHFSSNLVKFGQICKIFRHLHQTWSNSANFMEILNLQPNFDHNASSYSQ